MGSQISRAKNMDPLQGSSKMIDSNSEPRIQDFSTKIIPSLVPKEPLHPNNLISNSENSNLLSWIHDSNNCSEETDPLDLNSKVIEPAVVVKQEIIDSENIDFQSYVDAAKEDKIPWNQFIDLVSNLTSSSMSKHKQLNSILMRELKGYKFRENELLNEIEILKVTLESSRLDVKKLKQELYRQRKILRQTKFRDGNFTKSNDSAGEKPSANCESTVQDIQMVLPKNPLTLLTGK